MEGQKLYNICWEINEYGSDPIDAVRKIEQMIEDQNANWVWIVQDSDTGEIFSVDREEPEEDQIFKMDNYDPAIFRKEDKCNCSCKK